jgi:diadenosine tetraphosphate (Ap4A) HIT family hydrolase
MALIYETPNFILESHERPEIDRLEGGHMKISPKRSVEDRTKLTPAEAVEMARLTMVSGEAMKSAMAKRGVNIGRINYQDNGNWKPELHIHLYGRAVDARVQKFGDPIVPGHKESFEPLDEADIREIAAEIERLFKEERFSDGAWGL